MKIKWHKIKEFSYKYRWALIAVFVFCVLFFLMTPSFASGSWLNPANWLSNIKGAAADVGQAVLGALIYVTVLILHYALLTPIYYAIAIMVWALVEVSSFQYFIHVPAVVTGWTIMRDLVNMGFVVYLLYLAFSTIISVAGVNLEKGIVHLVLAVILVNFSRMIVGLFIDLSQIVMLTFVNGFRNIAGGNVINKLGLKSFFELKEFTSDPSSAGQMFITKSLGIIFGAFLLAILTMMVAYLIIRVVKLWILTVFSPLMALGSLSPINKVFSSFTGKWKTEFSAALMGGPFMAFGIWFSLMIISQTGDKAAITTPSGAMSDNLGTFGADGIGNNLFTMTIGIALMYASYKQAQSMAGSAAVVGAKTLDFTKGYAKWVDRKVGAITTRATGRDISFGGVKDTLKEGGKYLAKRDIEFDKDMRERGVAARLRRSETWTKAASKVPVLGALTRYGRLEKQEQALGFETIKGEYEAQKRKVEAYKEGKESGTGKVKDYFNNLESTQSVLSEMKAGGPDGRGNVSREHLDKLINAGLITAEEADILEKGKFQEGPGGGKFLASAEEESQREDVYNRLFAEANTGVNLKKDLESGDETSVKNAFDNLASRGVLSTSEADSLKKERTGAGAAMETAFKAQEEKYSSVKGEVEKLAKEKSKVIKDKLIKARTSLTNRVQIKRRDEEQKKLNAYFDEKYHYVDSPDEIADIIKQSGLKDEELYYLMRKAGGDMTEVLRELELPENLSGLKILMAEQKLGSGAKRGDYAQSLDAMRKGEFTDEQDSKITNFLNKQATQVAIETLQQVGKANEKDNASFSFPTSRKPDGVDKILTEKRHQQFIEGSFLNGDISSGAMSKSFTQKDESGSEHITPAGLQHIMKYYKKIKKDPYSSDLPLAVWDAVSNDKEPIIKALNAAIKKGLAEAKDKDGKPLVWKDQGTGSMIPWKDLTEDKQNQLLDSNHPVMQAIKEIENTAGTAQADKKEQLRDLLDDVLNKNR